MKQGQNYYKRMAVDAILEKLDISNLVDIFNRMAEDNNYSIRIFDNTRLSLSENLFPCTDAWGVLDAATKGRWLMGDAWAYLNESSRGTELHSFSRISDKDCPIYLSELLDWLERNDYAALEDIYTKDDFCQEIENAFRMFAEEDEGFTPVGIGIFIGQNGGIDLFYNWDNYIIEMYSR